MWVLLAILSGLCLGFYDVSKKLSLRDNSVIHILTLSICISSIILAVPLILSIACPKIMDETMFYVPTLTVEGHLFVFIKSAIVLSSWGCAYVAVKHLPLSVVSPMQATRPMWTLLGALFIFGESLNGWQWLGVVCAIGSIFVLSIVERRNKIEKSHDIHDRLYYICLAAAIILGAASGLYDKYMMRRFDHNAVQVYYTFYQGLMMLCILLISHQKKHSTGKSNSLKWTWAIPCISIFLVLSDYVYLLALTDPSSLIAVVSTIRRGGTLIPFIYGLTILHEPNPLKKVVCMILLVFGLVCLTLGSL